MKSLFFEDLTRNKNGSPYIIAEIGVNHEGSLAKAFELINLAKSGGAHAAKFQSYKAETLASKYSPAYWDLEKEPTQSQYTLFKKYDSFEEKDYIELSEYCQSIGIDFLSTPFDDNSIDFLDPLMPIYKIASADITNYPFLKKIAKKNKPIILSTGASTLSEIQFAVNLINAHEVPSVTLMHCILNYPTKNKDAHLRMIDGLKLEFPDYIIGYSDHTMPDIFMTSLITSWMKGAMVIEKHFTDNKNLPGNDHYHAMDVSDLRNLNSQIANISILLGDQINKGPIVSEEISRLNARRSIVLKKHKFSGEIINESDITYKRPGIGISPIDWDRVVGMRVNKELPEDSILNWDDLN
jgi:sialic acid synthase SpsE